MEDIATLPYRKIDLNDKRNREYWGNKVKLVECHGSGSEPKVPSTFRSNAVINSCPICGGAFDLEDGKLIRHAKMIDLEKQALLKIEEMANLLDLDGWGDAAVKARAAARDCRENDLDAKVAAGMHHLQTAIIKRSAATEAARAVKKMNKLKVGDEMAVDFSDSEYYSPGDEDATFMSEAFLYPLLGKEAARSVLYTYERISSAIGE